MKVDFIIVGQGIAGTLLGSALEDLGKSFVVIDTIDKYASSRQAAGIINPITGRRYVKTWNYDQLERSFVPVYQTIEHKIEEKILFDHLITLCLASIKEENDLLSQSLRYGYDHKLTKSNAPTGISEKNRTSFYQLQGYKLEIEKMCNVFRDRWSTQNKLIEEKFDYNKLKIEGSIEYKDISATTLVFCEGAFISNNPYFNNIGIVPNKGQFLIIENKADQSDISIKDKIIITKCNTDLWVGATYEWSFDDPAPDQKGKNEILQSLNDLYDQPILIKSHLSGLRPTTKDRRPIIAQHNEHTSLWCINGFGTKGSSLGPYLIERFLKILFEGLENEFRPKISF